MKCFIAGGTGVIGRRTVAELIAAGHDVTVLSRSERTDVVVADLGGTPVRVDLFDRDDLTVATSGHDAVINLATSIPPLRQAVRRSAWSTNERIRTEGVDSLLAAAHANGIERYVQESVTFFYVDAADVWIDETHPRSATGDGQSMAHAEASVAEHCAQGGDGVVLRFGLFYDVDSDHTATHATMARRRLDPFVGDPSAYLALTGVPAAARAVVASLSVDPGPYNVVDDAPVTRAQVASDVARRVGVRPLRRIPTRLVRTLAPESETQMRSQRVSNEAFRTATGWRPDHAGADGLADTLAELAR